MSAFDPKRTSIIDASPDLRRRYSPQRAVLFVPLCFSDMSQCRPTMPTGMGMLGNLPTDPGQHQQYASLVGPGVVVLVRQPIAPCRTGDCNACLSRRISVPIARKVEFFPHNNRPPY